MLQQHWLPLIKNQRETLEALLVDQSPEERKASKAEIERLKKAEAAFSESNLAGMRQEALALLQQLVSEYANVKRPTRHWSGPARVRLIDITDARLQWDITTAERAPRDRCRVH